MTKRIIALVLALAALAVPAFADFSDVAADAWYYEAVGWAEENGVMDGVAEGSFDPDGALTRAMVVTLLYRLAGEPGMPESDWGYPYSDVGAESWYAASVYWARLEGVAEGVSDEAFDPDGAITREQLVAMLYRYAGSPEVDSSADFADAADISPWAAGAVAWAVENGLVSGRDGNVFDPKGSATRAECASILMRFDAAALAPHGPAHSVDLDAIAPNEYAEEAFSVEGGRVYYGDGSRFGIDVSFHQGDIDWAAVAGDGVEFALIRVGYRGYGEGELFIDECFYDNIEGALENGIDVGVYFFSQALSVEEALEEAEFTLDAIADYDVSGPVVFDWERISYDGGRTADASAKVTTDCARAFCEEVESWGYQPMVYTSPNAANVELYLDLLTDYPLWLAHYTKDLEVTDFDFHYDMWQYSSTGSVAGIDGNVDLNVAISAGLGI